MNEQIPTIGRIVVYNTTEAERNALRLLGCNASDELPAVIVAVWGDTPQSAINVKVMVDGNHPDLWKTSIALGSPDADGKYPGSTWHWPVIKK